VHSAGLATATPTRAPRRSKPWAARAAANIAARPATAARADGVLGTDEKTSQAHEHRRADPQLGPTGGTRRACPAPRPVATPRRLRWRAEHDEHREDAPTRQERLPEDLTLRQPDPQRMAPLPSRIAS
jgi:hypothetical protein